MSVRFIFGSPGSGKTYGCLREIESMARGDAPLYYLVPEQFSLQAEKLLLTSRRASVKAQALSFNRLAYRIFAKLGAPKGKLLDEAGRNMLLRRVMLDCESRLVYYRSTSDKQGFIDKLARAVAEFNLYRVTSEDLRLRAPESDEVLAGKLTDLALILDEYRTAVTDKYLLTDDILELLCQRLSLEPQGGGILSGSYFWLDGFYSFTPQELNVIKYLMGNAERVTVSLFAASREAASQIASLAKSLNVKVLPEIVLEKNKRHINSPGLHTLAGSFSVLATGIKDGRYQTKLPPALSPDGNASLTRGHGGVEIISAGDGYASAYEAARRCLFLVNEGNYRFRDIAVLCGDGGGQKKILQTVFDRYKIPLFEDSPAGVLSHPLTELIRSSLEIAVRGRQYEGVMRFLKTGLTSLTADEVDKLENYILAHGIKGYKWKYPFSEEIDGSRLKLLADTSAFEDLRPDSKDSVLAFCRRITDMLYSLDIPGKLTRLHRSRMEAEDPDTARIHRQIWPKICDILDKLAEILGDERVTLRAFSKFLDAGLSQADLGRIPPTADQVFLGDAGRTRYPIIKAMIVIGANDGRLPAPVAADELLSDFEREQLENTDLALSQNGSGQTDESWFSLCCALCQPSETLTVIYSESEGGKQLRPSPLIGRLKTLFPGISVKRAAGEADELKANGARERREDMKPNGLARSSIGEASYSHAGGAYILSEDSTRKLYGKTIITAASRLERYASCPFAYYAAFNLKARERKIYDVNPTDLGVLYHAVLEEFAKMLDATGKEWGSFERAEISAYVDDCVDVLSSEPDNVLRNTARNLNVLRKVKRICVTSIWALCEHIKRGNYKPFASEVEFSDTSGFAPGSRSDASVAVLEVRLDNNRRMLLTGRIDRVDLLQTENGCYVKIIDYKSGRIKFDLAEVMQGTQLQLILYMSALIKMSKEELKPGGVFYFHLDDPMLNTDDIPNEELREEMLLECFKMSGLAVAEEESVNGMDINIVNKGRSHIIPVSVNKGGGYSKASSVAPSDYFDVLGKMAEDKIKELGMKMTEGIITPEPLKKGKSLTCDYCPFKVICGYNSSI